MIVFDLRCTHGHVFEAWFGSSSAYDRQRIEGLLVCPVCGDPGIEKAVMAPNIAPKNSFGRRHAPMRSAEAQSEAVNPTSWRAVISKIAEAQARTLETSEWVGGSFATRARAMHDGDEPSAVIHGQATLDEARGLIEDGVAVAPLLVPVVSPDRLN